MNLIPLGGSSGASDFAPSNIELMFVTLLVSHLLRSPPVKDCAEKNVVRPSCSVAKCSSIDVWARSLASYLVAVTPRSAIASNQTERKRSEEIGGDRRVWRDNGSASEEKEKEKKEKKEKKQKRRGAGFCHSIFHWRRKWLPVRLLQWVVLNTATRTATPREASSQNFEGRESDTLQVTTIPHHRQKDPNRSAMLSCRNCRCSPSQTPCPEYIHPRSTHSPSPTAAPLDDLQELPSYRSVHSTGTRSPAPTAAPQDDLLQLPQNKSLHPTGTRSPSPTAAPPDDLLQLHMHTCLRPTGTRLPSPTAASPDDLLELPKHKSVPSTHTRSPSPTAAPSGDLLELHMSKYWCQGCAQSRASRPSSCEELPNDH